MGSLGIDRIGDSLHKKREEKGRAGVRNELFCEPLASVQTQVEVEHCNKLRKLFRRLGTRRRSLLKNYGRAGTHGQFSSSCGKFPRRATSWESFNMAMDGVPEGTLPRAISKTERLISWLLARERDTKLWPSDRSLQLLREFAAKSSGSAWISVLDRASGRRYLWGSSQV